MSGTSKTRNQRIVFSSTQEAKTKAKRFLPLSLSVVLSLGEGRTIRSVYEQFHISRQRVEYHAKKALKHGWLRKQGTYPALYYLTEEGKQKFLAGGEGVGVNGEFYVRSHGASLKFPIVRMPKDRGWELFVKDSREAPLKNWCPRYARVGGLAVAVTPKHVVIWVNSLWVESGHFKEDAVLKCLQACQEVAQIMCSKYGFQLDVFSAKFSVPPQYALPDFFTGDKEKIRLSFKKGHIDYSKGFRELEYNDAKHLSEFLSMPEQIADLNRKFDMVIEKPKYLKTNYDRDRVLGMTQSIVSDSSLTSSMKSSCLTSMILDGEGFIASNV